MDETTLIERATPRRHFSYVHQCNLLFRQLKFLKQPTYLCDKILQGNQVYWSVEMTIPFQTEAEGTLVFRPRHARSTPGAAVEDVFREALQRLCETVPYGPAQDFGMHPFRAEGDTQCQLHPPAQEEGSRCTLLAELACTAENAYEKALNELDLLRVQYADLENRYQELNEKYTKLTLLQASGMAHLIGAECVSRSRKRTSPTSAPVAPPPSP